MEFMRGQPDIPSRNKNKITNIEISLVVLNSRLDTTGKNKLISLKTLQQNGNNPN